ncbi:MAG: low molecular weight phosphotyrosine protein phosphatase [Oscillospiraceae bacterium]|nr:low molecular weight phosphotyrosine protein phosphatase [Oscillospiraceae bacterium]
MVKILFVCHGNICRSPMAEFVMKQKVKKAKLEHQFEIASAATSTEEIWNGIGNPVYPPVKKLLAKNGINCDGKRARQMTKEDYSKYDLIIGMDNWNMRNMLRIVKSDPENKIRLLMDYTERPGEVADPWYSGDFEATWRDINEGCDGILKTLLE